MGCHGCRFGASYIHGTNQPEYIGRAISSGCIRMTNEDVIDLYTRVKIGATVVVRDRVTVVPDESEWPSWL